MTINQAYANKRPTGGMIPRKRETLKGPLQLARVGHSSSKGVAQSHEQNLSSPWWVSRGTMEHLWRVSRDSSTPLATLLRQKCCIPYYWNSTCDLIYEAEVVGYVDAWFGPGTFFFPEKSLGATADSDQLWPLNDIVFFPAGEFPQIFIPGLWDEAVRGTALTKCQVVPMAAFASAQSYLGPSRSLL